MAKGKPWAFHFLRQGQKLVFESQILAMFAAPHSKATQLVHISITTIVSNKVHIFSGCRDMHNSKPWAFHFFEKTCSFLDEAKH